MGRGVQAEGMLRGWEGGMKEGEEGLVGVMAFKRECLRSGSD